MRVSILRAIGLVFVSIGACPGPSQRTASPVPQSPVEVESALDASLAMIERDPGTERATPTDHAIAANLGGPEVADDAGVAEDTEGPFNPRGPRDGGRSGASYVEPPRRTTSIGRPCDTNEDCTPNGICGFPGAAHCAARGTCFRLPRPRPMPRSGGFAAEIATGCGCDGTNVPLVSSLPKGFYRRPLRHEGDCHDGEGTSYPPRKPSPCEVSCHGDPTCTLICVRKLQR